MSLSAPSAPSDVPPPATAVDKALLVLRTLAGREHEVGVSELARDLALTKSTTFRLLGILERNAAVERVDGMYRLGPQMLDMGRRAFGTSVPVLREALLPHLADLYELTHETVHLAVLRGTDIVYVNKLHGHRATRTPSRIGSRLPAHCTGVGKALLAWDPDAADGVIAGGLAPRTARTITDPALLREELAAIRREGVARDREEATAGLVCVAVPVLGPDGRAVAALSVAGSDGRFHPDRYGTALRRVAFDAARTLTAATRAHPATPDRAAG